MEVMDWTLMNLEQHSGRFLGKEKMTSRYCNGIIVATLQDLLYYWRCHSMIKALSEESNGSQAPAVDPIFYLPNGYTMKKAQLAAICLATEIAEEVLNCQGTTTRMNAFTKDVTQNPSAYTGNGATVIKTVKLIKKELRRIKKDASHSNISKAVSEIKRQSSRIEEVLCQVGIDSRKPEELPSMHILHEDGRFYRTHQYFIKNKLWDITQ